MGPNPVRHRESGPKEGTGSTGIPQDKRNMGKLGHGQSRWGWLRTSKCCKLDTESDPDSTVEEGCREGAGWGSRSRLDTAGLCLCSRDVGLVVAGGQRGTVAPEVVSIHSPLLK